MGERRGGGTPGLAPAPGPMWPRAAEGAGRGGRPDSGSGSGSGVGGGSPPPGLSPSGEVMGKTCSVRTPQPRIPKAAGRFSAALSSCGEGGSRGAPLGLSPNTQRLARRPLCPCPGFGGVPGPAWLLRLCLCVPPSRPAPQGRPQESGSPGARALRSPGRKRGQLNPEDRADKGAPGPALSHPVHNSPGNKQEAVCFHLSSKNTRISSRCSGLPPKAPLNPRGAGREGGPGLGRVLPWAAPHRVPGQAGSARPLQSLSEPTAGSWQGSQGP